MLSALDMRMRTGDPMDDIVLAHAQYLMPAHLRKGKGGRQPAMDPRSDPRVDTKKARRILANRLSAARSKMRQKTAVHVRVPRVSILNSILIVVSSPNPYM